MKKKKCFLGAAISLAGSIATGVLSAKQEAKKMDALAAIEERKNKQQQTTDEINAFNTRYGDDANISKAYRDRFTYKCGGKKKANGGVEPVITEGGVAKPLGNDTYLLRGRSHAQDGIVIGRGKNSIEAEGGEVVKVDKDIKILSKEPITDKGVAPAKIALSNPAKFDKAFEEQESYKRKHKLNDDGSRKAKLGIKTKTALGIGADVVSGLVPIVSGLISKNKLDKIAPPKQAPQLTAKRLKTNYNINPQLAEVKATEEAASTDIRNNTTSSAVSNARINNLRFKRLSASNSLLGQKENIETGLINADAQNQQQVAAQNQRAQQAHLDKTFEFERQKALGQANINNQMLGSVSDGIRDIQLRADKKASENKALAAIAAKNPEQVDLFLKNYRKLSNLDTDTFKCGGKRKAKRKC